MKLFAKRSAQELEEMRDITDDVQECDFVPYACHYDPHTILTKNGELLQTIKIVGFHYEAVTSDALDLRATIRKAVLESIETTSYAIWFHTIRRKTSLRIDGKFPEDFSRKLDEAWNKINQWGDKYTNEVYVTVVREGQSSPFPYPWASRFYRGLVPHFERKFRDKYIDAAFEDLDATVLKMLDVLDDYGAVRLGLKKENGVYYSEPLTFLSKIINLTDVPMPLPDADLSQYLTQQEVTFGFNAMEVRSQEEGRRRFGAILTLKEYKEQPGQVIDRFLQLPVEFIVTQCVDFINHKKALAEFQQQANIYRISNSENLSRITGIRAVMESNRGKATDFCEQQMCVFILADSIKELESAVKMAVAALSSIGIIMMREDYKFEEGYWSQLPANFEFVRRLKPINTPGIGGFANLSNVPAGVASANLWGPAVTLFRTAAQTPYYFNFHMGEIGHTTIIGPYGSGKTVLLNFLLAQARRFEPQLFCFDYNRGSELFLRAIGGDYLRFTPQGISNGVTLNPFSLEPLDENKAFLEHWLLSLLGAGVTGAVRDNYQQLFRQGIAYIYQQPPERRTLSTLIAQVRTLDNSLAIQLMGWHDQGNYAALFDHANENLSLSSGIVGFDMTELVRDGRALVPVLSYLLHRIILLLDGDPSIIVLDEAWKLLDNPLFSERLEGWLEMLTENNTVAVLTTENVYDAAHSQISSTIMHNIATQIYLPDDNPDMRAYQEVFGLSQHECAFLDLMEREQRHFMLKRSGESIVATLNLEGLNELMSVLSSTPKSLDRMQQLINQLGPEPRQWLPPFLEEMKHA